MLDILDLEQITNDILREIHWVKRPLLIFGAGIKSAIPEACALLKRLRIPVIVTWGARDVFPDAPSFGTHGERAGNFAVQTADYIITVGTRLDTKATGSPTSSFAPMAKLVMVDIDGLELDKMQKIGRPLYRSIRAEASQFLRMLEVWVRGTQTHDGDFPEWTEWHKKIADWRKRFPVIVQEYRNQISINPYVLVDALSEAMSGDDVLVSDTGCGVAWLMQAFKFKGQRFIHAFNQTPMGYGLPAAVGAAFAAGRRVVLVTGDGGLSVNVTELATVARHNLQIKILLLNNNGHAMCRQTQRQWLKGEYPATSYAGGLATPDFVRVAAAYNIPADRISQASEVEYGLEKWLSSCGPKFLECIIPQDADIVPLVRFGKSIEDADPALPDVAEILAEVTECVMTV